MSDAQGRQAHAPTILVVEDDGDTREFYADLLATAGYHVLAAATGRAALAHVGGSSVHGVLLDRRLPDMDGLSLCRHFREHLDQDAPILFVTADHDPALEVAARAAGATAFIAKPFLPNVLLDLLAALVPV